MAGKSGQLVRRTEFFASVPIADVLMRPPRRTCGRWLDTSRWRRLKISQRDLQPDVNILASAGQLLGGPCSTSFQPSGCTPRPRCESLAPQVLPMSGLPRLSEQRRRSLHFAPGRQQRRSSGLVLKRRRILYLGSAVSCSLSSLAGVAVADCAASERAGLLLQWRVRRDGCGSLRDDRERRAVPGRQIALGTGAVTAVIHPKKQPQDAERRQAS